MAVAVPKFDKKLESWESYQERLENYFITADIVDPSKKKALLLNSVGPETYERVRNICYPSAVNDRLYEELLEVFSGLFTPPIVTFKERKTFYDAKKRKNEKAADWHERLCRLSVNCKFGTDTENILRDKFVVGFEGIVFEKFCSVGTNLTLREALEIAKVYEIQDVGAPKAYSPKVAAPKTTKENQPVKKEPKPAKEYKQKKEAATPKKEAKPKK